MLDNKLITVINKWSNSFLRPLVPPKLMSNSEIVGTEDDGAKLIYLKFLYGIQSGTLDTRPTDGGVGNIITDLNEESLWIYSLKHEVIPEGFNEKKYKGGVIGTGDIRKCGTCRGHGKVRCKTCGGKVRWSSKNLNGDIVDHVCSCGDGKELCKNCDGFGEVEVIIRVKKEFKVFQTKNSQYTGEVPDAKVKKITGDLVYEQIYDYPLDLVREMLLGGITSNEFSQLNNAVLNSLKEGVQYELEGRDINIESIHSQLDKLFNSIPNPERENTVLEYETMPVRVMVRVENASVKQIDYKYKDKPYSIWVYGKENSVWKKKAPFSWNYKLISLLAFAVICGVLVTVYSFVNVPNEKYSEATFNDRHVNQDVSNGESPNNNPQNNHVEGSGYQGNAVFVSTSMGTTEYMERKIENGQVIWYYSSEKGGKNLKLGRTVDQGVETVFFHSSPDVLYKIYFEKCGFKLNDGNVIQEYYQKTPRCNN